MKLRFITEELAFESDEDSARFICEHGAQAFLYQGPGESEVVYLSGKVGNIFEIHNAAFGRVDIRGC